MDENNILGFFQTNDFGKNWNIKASYNNHFAAFLAKDDEIIFHSIDMDQFYMFYSKDQGENWDKIPLPSGTYFAFSSEISSDKVFIGTQERGVFYFEKKDTNGLFFKCTNSSIFYGKM